MNRFRFHRCSSVWLSLVITLLASLLAMSAYLTIALDGDIDHHMLPAAMFGVPQNLQAKGITPFYTEKKESGWDGQFYYFIANDVLATQDTPQHIDSPAYRYQRIGLPLLANVISKLLGRDWVSPTIYYLTNLGLVLAATFLGASFFRRRGVSGYWILLWSLSVGTQLTLLNALPDAAADAALIIAFVALADKRWWLYGLAISLALLSREAYLIVALIIGGFLLLPALINQLAPSLISYAKPLASNPITIKQRAWQTLWLIVPLFVFAGWHGFIRMRFGMSPATQATGILGLPLVSAAHYVLQGLQGMHPLFPSASHSRIEALSVTLFLSLLTLAAGTAFAGLRKYRTSPNDAVLLSSTLVLLTLSLFYTAFGNTVMMHWTGYMKAATIFFFLIPFVQVSSQGFIKRFAAVYLIFLWIYFNGILSFGRILVPQQSFESYTHQSTITDNSDYACLKHYDANVEPTNFLKILNAPSLLSSFMHWRIDKVILDVKFTNRSTEAFPSTTGRGGVYYSYHWLNQDDKTVVIDGIRSAIAGGLQPGQSANAQLVVSLPKHSGKYLLRLTPVQEGCAWFYQRNPSSAFDIQISIE